MADLLDMKTQLEGLRRRDGVRSCSGWATVVARIRRNREAERARGRGKERGVHGQLRGALEEKRGSGEASVASARPRLATELPALASGEDDRRFYWAGPRPDGWALPRAPGK